MTEGLAVSPNFFSVLGVTPLMGRAFMPEEAQNGRDKEVILTWGAWQRLFHGDPSVIGTNLRVSRGAENHRGRNAEGVDSGDVGHARAGDLRVDRAI